MGKHLLRIAPLILVLTLFSVEGLATPGEYSFHFKMGPSFNVDDQASAFRVGGNFDYELGYGFGFELTSMFGLGEEPNFLFIPSAKYDIIYFVPGTLYLMAGAGYQLFNFDQSGLTVRMGTGIKLPLKGNWEFISDVNFFVTPDGPGSTSPMTFDWFTGLGIRY